MKDRTESLEYRLILLLEAAREGDIVARSKLNELVRTDSSARATLASLLSDEYALDQHLSEEGSMELPEPINAKNAGTQAKPGRSLRGKLAGTLSGIMARLFGVSSTDAGRFPRQSWRILTAAVVLVGLAAVAFHSGEKAANIPVATLLRTEDAVWSGQLPTEGGRLNTGGVRLRSGRAILRLDGGAELLLVGSVDLRLDDGGTMTLFSGEVRARVPDGATGFTVHTPGGKVVDLGTEFIANVTHDGKTEVNVLKGEVEVPDAVGVVHRLTDGDGLALDRQGMTRRLTALRTDTAWHSWTREEKDTPREGRLFLRETFDYPLGDGDPAALNGGKGWAGPWAILQGKHAGQPWSGKMHQMEVAKSEGRNSWVSPVGKTRCQRLMAQPLSLKEDAVRYVSLSWFEPSLPYSNRQAGFWPLANIMIDLRGPEGSEPGQRVGLRVNHLMQPTIESGAGQGFDSRVRVMEGRRLLMVGKILSREKGEDEVSLRVFDADEPPGLMEPKTWDVVTRGLRLDAVLDRVVLESIGPKPRSIEEIRIGANWHDVVAGWNTKSKATP
jgi:hypothetical protein